MVTKKVRPLRDGTMEVGYGFDKAPLFLYPFGWTTGNAADNSKYKRESTADQHDGPDAGDDRKESNNETAGHTEHTAHQTTHQRKHTSQQSSHQTEVEEQKLKHGFENLLFSVPFKVRIDHIMFIKRNQKRMV